MKTKTVYLETLNMLQKNSSKSDGKIACYIMSNLETVAKLTLETISHDTGYSYATVCRFFKKAGSDGFISFKKSILDEIEKKKNNDVEFFDFNNNLPSNMSYEQISRHICSFSAGVVSNCFSALSADELANIISLLTKAQYVYFTGLGTSAITAKYAYTKFFRLKMPCSFDSDVIIAKMKASILKKGDLLFAISSSGRTKDVVDIAKIAHSSGAKIISICDFTHSPLSNISDISICTTVRNSNKYVDVDFPLIQGQITIIDILYTCFYNHTLEVSSQNFTSTKQMVSDNKIS